MTLEAKLLKDAQTLRDKLIDAQFEADRTALAYQHAIRKLHVAGGSLREIAEALGLSHQRVHQIVDPDSGKGALKQERKRKRKGEPRHCSFCLRAQADVRKLIAGPGAYICDDCVDLAAETIAAGAARSNDLTRIKRANASTETCNFCGKKPKQVEQIVVAHEVTICNECLDLCREILVEEGDRPAVK